MNQITRMSILLLAISAAAGCGNTKPRALVEGHDSCEYCRMSISDARFGAQLITSTGKVHTFDSVECLAGFAASLPTSTEVSGIYVTDFAQAGTFVPADDAIYLVDGRIESPMGRRIVAFAPDQNDTVLRATYGGSVKTWTEVRRLVAEDSLEHAGAHSHSHAPVTAEGGRAR